MLTETISKIRLLFKKNRESYLCLYRILGFIPGDLSIYQEALQHKSVNIRKGGRLLNNERLEFLGDAILDAIITDILYLYFDKEDEGFLTNTRSKIVKRETLNKLALNIGLHKLVKSSNHIQSHNFYMYGNALEAFIGAVYIDKGYDVCKQFVYKRIILPNINLVDMSKRETNFKSRLIEWSQKNKSQITFELIEQSTDRDLNPIFHTEVLIEGICSGKGEGYSKKESQQNAAKMALSRLKNDPSFVLEIDNKRDARINSETETSEELAEACTHAETLDN